MGVNSGLDLTSSGSTPAADGRDGPSQGSANSCPVFSCGQQAKNIFYNFSMVEGKKQDKNNIPRHVKLHEIQIAVSIIYRIISL